MRVHTYTGFEKPSHVSAVVKRLCGNQSNVVDDRVAVEVPVAFVYNCENHAVMMASPRDLIDFAYGFSLAEGIVREADEVVSVSVKKKGAGISLSIQIPKERAELLAGRSRNLEGRTGCGLCGIADITQALRPLSVLPDSPRIPRSAVVNALAGLPKAQSVNEETGAVHGAALAGHDGNLLCVREDVGRHNALDKLIGAATCKKFDPLSGFVVVTSRCSMEMVQKTVTFGCPVLISVSAPTSLALELAEKSNLTIAAFARDDRINLYSHPERVI